MQIALRGIGRVVRNYIHSVSMGFLDMKLCTFWYTQMLCDMGNSKIRDRLFLCSSKNEQDWVPLHPAPINSFMLLFINFSFQNLIWIRIAQIWWMECKTETFCANIMSISEIIFQENKNFEKASISEQKQINFQSNYKNPRFLLIFDQSDELGPNLFDPKLIVRHLSFASL